jgi:predicted esterase
MLKALSWILAFSCLAGFARAEWIGLPWPALGADLPVWKPDDFDPSKRYPAIVYYHGTGGSPNASYIHRVTEGRDFVLVGMTYAKKGAFEYSDGEIANSLGLLNALKKTLVKSFAVDPQRIYVGGFSKGGWHTAMLLDRDRSLAGGLIFGGGAFEKRPEAPAFSKQLPVFIGCGRYDGNYPQSLGALVHFRKLGAEVALDAWPDIGHAFPQNPPEALRQWLRMRVGGEALETEAGKWISKRLPELLAISDPVECWFAVEEFVTLPFVKYFGAGEEKSAREKIAELLTNPAVATEKKWRDESRKILARESRDRLLGTLQAASADHAILAVKAAGTRAGADALRDLERTRQLLETAKVVSRPSKPGSGAVTPELPPAAPSANPERSPFLPPGIKVKPAK